MTRNEHLEWSKDRATAYLPDDPQQAFTSMLIDLKKHPDLTTHLGIELGAMHMMLPGWIDSSAKVRDFIQGFN